MVGLPAEFFTKGASRFYYKIVISCGAPLEETNLKLKEIQQLLSKLAFV